jgi:energy-coupling factor transport system substrate-specific component
MPSKTRLLALVASLSAANAAMRIGLSGLPPNVRPTTFLTIIAGVVAGPIPGLVVGWLSIVISDIALGPGLWTIETSAWMALVGLLAGLFWYRTENIGRLKMAIGGYLLTVLFDIGTSVPDAFIYGYPWWTAVLGLYVPFIVPGFSPWPFGFAHELTTAMLCAIIGPSLTRQIRKIYQRASPSANRSPQTQTANPKVT